MVVYICYIKAAGNSISSQLGSSCQGNQYGTEKAGSMGMALPSRTTSHQPGRRAAVFSSPLVCGEKHKKERRKNEEKFF